MKTWSSFYSDVLPYVSGCPNPVMDHALRRAAQEFFSRAHVWRVWLETVMTHGLTEYDLPLEQHSELVKIERATLNGRTIHIIAREMIPADWQTNRSGFCDSIFTADRKLITMLPGASDGETLRIEAVLKPSNASAGVLDDHFDNYVEAISNGAKARLMMLPGVYFNPEMAGYFKSAFDAEIAKIGIQEFRSFSSALPRARIQTF
jgi:hypothetical protein